VCVGRQQLQETHLHRTHATTSQRTASIVTSGTFRSVVLDRSRV
jgi:hypothetical protein